MPNERLSWCFIKLESTNRHYLRNLAYLVVRVKVAYPGSFVVNPGSFVVNPGSFVVNPGSFVINPGNFVVIPGSWWYSG